MSNDRIIMLVEDNPKDEELTLRALKKTNIMNPIVVARDGAEALDYLFSRGVHARRDPAATPQFAPPGPEAPESRWSRSSREFTKNLPVVVLTSLLEDQDLVRSYSLGANSYVRKPVVFVEFIDAVRQLGMYWRVLNETAPVQGDL